MVERFDYDQTAESNFVVGPLLLAPLCSATRMQRNNNISHARVGTRFHFPRGSVRAGGGATQVTVTAFTGESTRYFSGFVEICDESYCKIQCGI